MSHLTVLFADDWGPDQRDREVDRWPLCLKCSTGLSECGYLTGKPFAGASSQIDNPATSPSPFPIHSDLRTTKNKYSRSERSRFAEPAHIAAETILATHKRTRCVLKRFADGSQPTLLGVLLAYVRKYPIKFTSSVPSNGRNPRVADMLVCCERQAFGCIPEKSTREYA